MGMNINRIEPINFNMIYNVMTDVHISASEKETFIRNNSIDIRRILKSKITDHEFQGMMANRPLIKFRPLKNSYTKWGDKILLAKSLGINPKDVPNLIDKISNVIENGDIKNLPKDDTEKLKTYVFRHGSKEELVNFLDYELSTADNLLDTLYRTLSYNTGGAADYFVRPIHRMNNKTLVNLYKIIDKNLTNAKNTGNISEEEHEKTAKWALVQILKIQNNSKLKNAIKIRNQLT